MTDSNAAVPRGRYVVAVRRTVSAGPTLVTFEVLARESGLHPELLERLIGLGAVEPRGGTHDEPLYAGDSAARLARVIRLRRDLGLNYAGAILACDLLSRIEELEHLLSRGQRTPEKRSPSIGVRDVRQERT